MNEPRINALRVGSHRVPLHDLESDGTLSWSATTVVTVEATAGGQTGLGWTYGPAAVAAAVHDVLAPVVRDVRATDIGLAHIRMRQAARNAPTPGLLSYAISAVDVALWDLKAKLFGVPLAQLLGRIHHRVPLYGSGGFTSMTERQLLEQLDGWLSIDGMTAVKIKIGEDRGGNVDRDLRRIALARKHIGPNVALMVDANGGYQTKQAVRLAELADAYDIAWFEEPVSSDHLADLAMLRTMLSAEVTAGEYGTTSDYFRAMLAANAVDCLQVDASRCGGYTGLLAVAAIADAYGVQISTHCAPQLHAPGCAAIPNLRHAEWFADHVYVDAAIFDGLVRPKHGRLPVQDDRPGHGVTLRSPS